MSERKKYDTGSVKVEKMLKEKRRGLGNKYKTREKFIELGSTELFDNNDWISPRHLANIRSGYFLQRLRKILWIYLMRSSISPEKAKVFFVVPPCFSLLEEL